jgi:hypothetical protein
MVREKDKSGLHKSGTVCMDTLALRGKSLSIESLQLTVYLLTLLFH